MLCGLKSLEAYVNFSIKIFLKALIVIVSISIFAYLLFFSRVVHSVVDGYKFLTINNKMIIRFLLFIVLNAGLMSFLLIFIKYKVVKIVFCLYFIAFLIVGFCLWVTSPKYYYSETQDINNYLIFDDRCDANCDFFPSRESFEKYEYDYYYYYFNGMIGEDIPDYEVVLKVDYGEKINDYIAYIEGLYGQFNYDGTIVIQDYFESLDNKHIYSIIIVNSSIITYYSSCNFSD